MYLEIEKICLTVNPARAGMIHEIPAFAFLCAL